MVLLAHHIQQATKDGTTEDHFLGKRYQDAHCHIAPRFFHQALEELTCVFVHLYTQLLVDELQRDDGSKGEQCHPQKREPRFRQQVITGEHDPFRLEEDNESDDAAEHRGDSQQGWVATSLHSL